MGDVNLVLHAVGRCVDACSLLLDLLIATFSWLIHFVSGTLPVACGPSLLEYWNFALFSFLTATEAVSSAGYGALHVVEGWLQMLAGVLESFKMVGHLLCHVSWRLKDVLHRGLISGSSILRQSCEGLCIALSLILYFVNTVVNVVLIGLQNCVSALAGAWEMVADQVHAVLELALTLLTFLYSCVVGASVLLWVPCQLLLDLLGGLGHIFFAVFLVDVRSLLITVAIISLALLLLNWRLPVVSVPPLRVRSIQSALDPALASQEVNTRTAQDTTHTDTSITETGLPSASEPSQPRQVRTRTSRPKSELLSLLKEQEERKKCVICQDLSKTVLLLPCRHLCLCRHCADVLSRHRHAQQRCCPLCRQPITQTMDVFL